MKEEKQKWNTIELDDFVVVVPETDVRPHGTKISETKYELTTDCACKPHIKTGEKGEIYTKPIVIHNSFEAMDAIDEILKPFF